MLRRLFQLLLGVLMPKVFHRVALVAVAILAVCVSLSGTALAKGTKSKPLSCTSPAGSTMLENGSARVFKVKGKIYACRRPKGRAHQVFVPRSYRNVSGNKVSDIQLAGPYVGFEQYVVDGTEIWLLNTRSGQARSIGGGDDQSHVVLGDYVLNQHGTVVWVTSHAGCLNPCTATSTLTATTATGKSTQLDQSTTVGSSDILEHLPITDLALSTSGLVVYWTDKGAARSARTS
jgi:hypothetical protein